MLAPVNLDPLADVVTHQYEQWVYPAPIWDLPAWLESSWQWFDPSHAQRMLWPDRDYRAGMDILVAGCGTNQAAVIAYTNPQARVVGIDVSSTSLGHHRHLAEKYDLHNLELHRLPIEDVGSLGREFDLIMSTGVLHHMADPPVGIAALAPCLRTDGVLALMLYATHGRIGVHMMQSVFEDMGIRQDQPGVVMVRDAIDQLGPQHPLRPYLAIANDLVDDAGYMDTFIPGRERSYTIDECREYVETAGLVFQDVFLKTTYYAPVGTASPFLAAVGRLPREQQWSVMQRVIANNACHFFMACRPERPRESYAIDFDSGDPLRYVPSLRKGCTLQDDVLRQSTWSRRLSPSELMLVRQIDGARRIREIVDAAMAAEALDESRREEVSILAQRVFKSLWQTDFVAMGIPEGATAR